MTTAATTTTMTKKAKMDGTDGKIEARLVQSSRLEQQPSAHQQPRHSLQPHPHLPKVNGQNSSKPVNGQAPTPAVPAVSAPTATAGLTSKPAEPVQSAVRPTDQSQFVAPHAHDVLCGRGGGINNHAGNRLFRKWVQERKSRYNLAMTKLEKTSIAREVVECVHAQAPRGRFLLRDDAGPWVEIDDARAMAKTSQALREGAPTIRAAAAQQLQQRTQSQSQQPPPAQPLQPPPAQPQQQAAQQTASQMSNVAVGMAPVPSSVLAASAKNGARTRVVGTAAQHTHPRPIATEVPRPIATEVRSISPPIETHGTTDRLTALEPLTSSPPSTTDSWKHSATSKPVSEVLGVEMRPQESTSTVIPNVTPAQSVELPGSTSEKRQEESRQATRPNTVNRKVSEETAAGAKRPLQSGAEESGVETPLSHDQVETPLSHDQFVAGKRALMENAPSKEEGDQEEEAPPKKQRRVTLEPELVLSREDTSIEHPSVGTSDARHDLRNEAVVESKEGVTPVSPTTTPMPFPPSPVFTTIAHIGDDDETVTDFAPLPPSVVEEIRHMDVFPLRAQCLEREHSIALSEMSWNNQVPADDEDDFFNPFENEDAILLAAAEALVTDEDEVRPENTG